MLATLRATPGILTSLVAPASAAELVWKPSPERWSICEILNHLTDVEKLNVGLRVRRILQEELPSFEDYDQNARHRDGAYANDDGGDALDRFCETRSATLAWLERSSPDEWLRRGRHPEVGEITAKQLLSLWAFHDLSHIRQIAELVKAACFWDDIGTLQKYYSVHP